MLNAKKYIVFDADDTLWDCQTHFDVAADDYAATLSCYADRQTVLDSLFEVERKNMPLLGFGGKAFTLSLIENALKISQNRLTGDETERILNIGRNVLELPATPLLGVVETLEELKKSHRLVLFTKGENQEQLNKLRRSGLAPFFDDVVIVDDKTESEYIKLADRLATDGMSRENVISQMTMVGNSFKSDIAPALKIGASAVYIPFYTVWQLEKTEEFDHPKLTTIHTFSDLLQLPIILQNDTI